MRSYLLGLVTALAGVAAWSGLRADEEKIELGALPKAVAEAVKARFDGAKFEAASKEVENGNTLYEVTLKYKGRSVDVTATPEGKIVSVETEIGAGDAPKAVADAIKTKYPDAKITRSEEIATMAFEFLVKSGDKLVEVKLDPFGKVLAEEKKTHEKDPR